jgi:4-amino-4-deoxy-L-arabinose transferase-like glycosyltransferase
MAGPAVRLVGARPYAVIAGLCLALYLPGLAAIPPLDRDEARFAQATRQMLQTGDFLHIRFQNAERNNKPSGIYWLQAAAVSLFSTPASTAIWPYRLPSLIGATAAAMLVFAFGAELFTGVADTPTARRIALIAAVLLASALGVVAEAHIAKTDAALLAAVTAGQGALGLAYVRSRSGRNVPAALAAVFWGAEIAAILLKGPVGPGLAAVTTAALAITDRDAGWLRSLRPAAGLIALVVVVGPWLVAIEHATAGRFLQGALGHDFGAKLVGARESHGAPPLSYLLLAFATFWPGSLLLVPGLVHGFRRRDGAATRFLLAWLVPVWVLLELVPTKLPHYALPLYPALALLAAATLVDGVRLPPANWARRTASLATVLWGVVTLGLAALLVAAPLRFGSHFAAAGVLGATLLVAIAAALLARRPGPAVTAAMLAALSLAVVVPAGLGVLPRLDRLWLSREAAALVADHPPVAAPLVAVGYNEPSLVFLLGTDLLLAAPGDAAERLVQGGEALVSNRDAASFLQAVGGRGLFAQPIGSVAGLDYSNGQPMVLTLYDVRPGVK